MLLHFIVIVVTQKASCIYKVYVKHGSIWVTLCSVNIVCLQSLTERKREKERKRHCKSETETVKDRDSDTQISTEIVKEKHREAEREAERDITEAGLE